jgi:hypothetical protein
MGELVKIDKIPVVWWAYSAESPARPDVFPSSRLGHPRSRKGSLQQLSMEKLVEVNESNSVGL